MTITGFLVVIFIVLLSTSSHKSYYHYKKIDTLTSLTQLPGLALSTPYLENRLIYYNDFSNRIFPQMQEYGSMDFVYAK